MKKPRHRLLAPLARLLASAILMTGMTAHAHTPLDPQAVERAMACDDYEAFVAALTTLPDSLATAASQGRLESAPLLDTNPARRIGGQWSYRFIQPMRLLQLEAVGIANSLGSLPALVVAFDEPLDAVTAYYDRAGFRFQCSTQGDPSMRSCEAARDVIKGPPGQVPLQFLVTAMESASLIKVGRTVAACTVVPREGNVFR